MKYKKIIIALLIVTTVIGATGIVYTIKSKAEQSSGVPTSAVSLESGSKATFTAAPSRLAKNETVYVNLDSAGKALKTTVSDKLTVDIPNCAVKDISSLTDIRQISSGIMSQTSGQDIIWHMTSTEFIYNGTSSKPLPIGIDISYYLEGKQISADSLKGKGGNVTVKIKLKNNESRRVDVNGRKATVYSPFIVIGGMLLTGNSYSAVEVNSGKVLSDASKDVVVMVGFPGINESLSVQDLNLEGLSFEDEFLINMYTTDFDAGNFYFAALPLSAIDIEFALPDTLGDALSGVSKLTEIQNMLSSIDIDSLMRIFSSESGNNINDLLVSLSNAMTLYNNNAALLGLLQKYVTDENMAQFKSFYSALEQADISNNVPLISSVASLLGIGDLLSEYQKIQPLLDSLFKDLEDPAVQAALEGLPETISSVTELKGVLDENADSIAQLAEFYNSESFATLMRLMNTYNSNKDLFAALASSSSSLEKIVPYLEVWFNLADDYKIYTEAPEGAETGVMFVFKTDSLV